MTVLEINTRVNQLLLAHPNVLIPKIQKDDKLEVIGTKTVMQGKQKVDGHYFATTMLKPKDVRLYFFPIYTHPNEFDLSPALSKMLKGKSCFHLKNLDEDLFNELHEMIETGVKVYQREEII